MPQLNDQDVAAIVTCMTNDEKTFLHETIELVISESEIKQVVLCIEEKNDWINSILGQLMHDTRLEILRIPMTSIGAVRNKAVQHVKMPWIAFCDGDDVWCKGKTLIQKNYAAQTGADFVGAGHYLMNEGGKVCAYGFSRYIPMPSTWLVRTEIMKQYPFNESVKHGSDGEWWIRVFHNMKKVKCPRTVARYRVRAQSVSTATASKKRKVQLIKIAEIPVLGLSVRILTYMVWIYTRNKPYSWMSDWTLWLDGRKEKELASSRK